MLSFKNFLNEEKNISPEKHVQILKKTAASLNSHVSRGGRHRSLHGMKLIDRYETHKEQLRNKSDEHWKKYCDDMKYDPRHDAYDFFA